MAEKVFCISSHFCTSPGFTLELKVAVFLFTNYGYRVMKILHISNATNFFVKKLVIVRRGSRVQLSNFRDAAMVFLSFEMKKKTLPLFMDGVQLSQATTRRPFTFYH